MQRRAVRLTILALLAVAALSAAYITWETHLRLLGGLAAERDIDARIDRMSAATAALGGAQQAYVAPGQQRGDALTRASVLVQQVYDDIAALRRVAQSSEAGPALLAFGQSMDTLVNVDDRARDHLRLEQDLMAADLLYTEARQAIEAMTTQLHGLRETERRSAEAERQAVLARQASMLGAVALIWFAGVLALVRAPAPRETPVPVDPSILPAELPLNAPAVVPAIDLGAAAKVCGELARLSSIGALPATLARTARVLDASGLVVWLGAGDQLFPATGHGYGPRALARLGPISRGSDNATATAWRTGEMSVVPGREGANGAIVTPLLAQSGCFGVLAAEVRHGRESDEATRAVAAMIAAQLSTLVVPWPAPSESEDPAAAETEESPAAPGGHDERSAASA